MRIKALCSFSGCIAMCKGEVRECSNEAVLSDLLHAGYVEEIKEKMKTEEETETAEKATETAEEVTEAEGKVTEIAEDTTKTTETTRKPRKKAVKAVENQ